jgi:adenylate cyclase class 2
MLEVEMKFPIADLTALEVRLAEWGCRPGPPIDEVDSYFNAPDRDFGQTDEALRLRRIGPANRVTYKGPKRDAQTKTRTEIEIPLADGDANAVGFTRLLQHLGYRAVRQVKKRRRICDLQRDGFALEVCLDDVDSLGPFVELEILAPEERLDEARNVLLRCAAELGLSRSERRSYLELLLGISEPEA